MFVKQQGNREESTGGLVGLGAGLIGNLTRRAPLVAYWHNNVTLTLPSGGKKNAIPKNGLQPPVVKCKFFAKYDTYFSCF